MFSVEPVLTEDSRYSTKDGALWDHHESVRSLLQADGLVSYVPLAT